MMKHLPNHPSSSQKREERIGERNKILYHSCNTGSIWPFQGPKIQISFRMSCLYSMFSVTFLFVLKVEVVAGKTVLILTWGQESLWGRVLRGAPHVPWPCPSSAGQPLGVLEVAVGPAQLEVVEVVIKVTVFCPVPLNCSVLPNVFSFFSFLFFFTSVSSLLVIPNTL